MVPELVVLGNLLVDDMVFPDGSTRMAEPGGAVLYASLGAALWGLRVGVASWRGADYPSRALEALASRGIDLAGVRDLGRTGLRTWLLYEGRRRQVIHRLDGPTHAEVSPRPGHWPVSWAAARSFHLAPMPFDVQRDLVVSLRATGAFVSVDPYALVREDNVGAWRDLLAGADAVFLSEDDLELEGAGEAPRTALSRLAGGRLALAVFKRGARGGVLFDARANRWVEWQAHAGEVVDPTGAGDAFAGGFLAGWLRGESAERAARRGVVSASFALESWGPARIMQTAPEEAETRRRAWFGE